MIKHFCDHEGCKREVDGAQLLMSLEMTGKVYCFEHYGVYSKRSYRWATAFKYSKNSAP